MNRKDQTMSGLRQRVGNLSHAEQECAENLPLRRDVVTLLAYLRNHRVVGTQATGNVPLKAIREVTALFVHPPELETTIGDRIFSVRSEDEVWALSFIHLLANCGSLLAGGKSQRWRLTEIGERFLQLPPVVQIAFLNGVWWESVDWVIGYPFEGMSKGLPPRFKETTRNCLLRLPIKTRVPAGDFADMLIKRTGLRWAVETELAPSILRGAVYQMVVYVLRDLGVAELELQEDKYSSRVCSFEITAFGRRLLETLEE